MKEIFANLGLILVLILINGIFSMSEMSLVSSTKARLQKLVAEKRLGAKTALSLHKEPNHFLSTVQVGITAIGILSGALGEDILREPVYQQLMEFPVMAPYAETLSLILTVALITYFSVVLGELVPKQLALQNPESIAVTIAKPMQGFAFLVSPLVWILSTSSNFLLRLLRLHQTKENTVTDEEIRIIMEMGSDSGVFHAGESQLVSNVMKLDEMRVGAIMVPRQDIFVIDVTKDSTLLHSKIENSPYTQIVICRDGFENVLGILHCGDLSKKLLHDPEINIEAGLRSPLYIQESMMLTEVLNQFRESRSDLALVVDEYGDIKGLVTLMDVLTSIVGDLPGLSPETNFEVIQRSDGSWLADAGIPINQLKPIIGKTGEFPGESTNAYHTLAGMILFKLERLPQLADRCEMEDWQFEIIDMDGSRIDKILVSLNTKPEIEGQP
jgi:putative hemolysin